MNYRSSNLPQVSSSQGPDQSCSVKTAAHPFQVPTFLLQGPGKILQDKKSSLQYGAWYMASGQQLPKEIATSAP